MKKFLNRCKDVSINYWFLNDSQLKNVATCKQEIVDTKYKEVDNHYVLCQMQTPCSCSSFQNKSLLMDKPFCSGFHTTECIFIFRKDKKLKVQKIPQIQRAN